MRIGALIFVLSILAEAGLAQPDTLWVRLYGGTGDDYASSMEQTADGGFLITGSTTSFGMGTVNFYLVKTDANGDTVWTKAYGNGGVSWCLSEKQVTDGYITCGFSNQSGSGSWQFELLKTNSDGVREWTQYFGEAGADWEGQCVLPFEDGYIMSGFRSTGDSAQAVLLKARNDGEPQPPPYLYSHGSIATFHSLKRTRDGGYILGGYAVGDSTDEDFFVLKTDSAFHELWEHVYGDYGADEVNDIIQTSDGGYAFAGPTTSIGPQGDAILMKLDSLGDSLWIRTYGGMDEDHSHTLVQTSDGGYILAGHTDSFGEGGDVYIVKTDADGNEQWHYQWGGNGLDVVEAIQETSDGGYVVGGSTSSYGAGGSDFFLIRFASDNGSGVGNRPEIPNEISLEQNYPNPFNAATEIRYTLAQAGKVKLSVYDLLGRETQILVDESASAGSHSIQFDAAKLGTGMYFYKLESGNTSLTRKMILMK